MRNARIYFHNLKFDGQFIIDYLLRKGVKYGRREGEFTCLIDNMGKWYNITYYKKYDHKKSEYSKKIVFLDSAKLLPMPLSEVAKAFEMEEVKGSIDYEKFRDVNYKATNKELAYTVNDTVIDANALAILKADNMRKSTIGACSIDILKNMIGRRNFKKLFPVLDNEVDAFFRPAYKGGIAKAEEKYQNIVVYNVICLDLNSGYPFAMLTEYMPYGEPTYFKGEYKTERENILFFQRFKCMFKLKEGGYAFLQIKNNPLFKATEFLKDSKGEIVELTLTSVDLEKFYKHYDMLYVEYLDGYFFNAKKGIFNDYINFYYERKKKEKGGKRVISKLMLNAPYGKFGKKTKVINKIPYLNEEGEVKFYETEEEEVDGIYLPVAAFTTAYMRKYLIDAAEKLLPHVAYSDTDSLKLVGITMEEVEKLLSIGSEIGQWKDEGTLKRAKFLHAKCYIGEDMEGNLKVTCGGMPEKVKENVTFESFEFGNSFSGKLTHKIVKGGALLEEVDFTIKESNLNLKR